MLQALSPATLAAFALASLVLAVTPGPGVLFVVTRTLTQGRAVGLASVLGVAVGNLANALAASAGLAALLAVSSAAFTTVQWAGAAYLVWLGVQTLRQRAPIGPAAGDAAAGRLLRTGREALWVALLNPKTALFFAAFVPQFIPTPAAGDAALGSSALLGSLFVLIALCTDTAYVFAAGWAARRLGVRGHWGRTGRQVSGWTLIGLGVWSAMSGGRAVG